MERYFSFVRGFEILSYLLDVFKNYIYDKKYIILIKIFFRIELQKKSETINFEIILSRERKFLLVCEMH